MTNNSRILINRVCPAEVSRTLQASNLWLFGFNGLNGLFAICQFLWANRGGKQQQKDYWLLFTLDELISVETEAHFYSYWNIESVFINLNTEA